MAKHELQILNKVQTHLITWGDPFNSRGQDVIICISGNPGVPGFYTEFGSALHDKTKLPVCVIGQAGHDEVPDKQSNTLLNQEHLFNLEGQIQHKQDLLESIHPESKIHLIGHSIGAWLILELLQQKYEINSKVLSVNLLFPTVQRMAESSSGRYLNNIIRKVHYVVIILYMILHLIPKSILRRLVDVYLKFKSIPQHYNESVLKVCNPKVGEKMLFLAYDEMDTVKALNNEIIEKVKEKTLVLYCEKDAWAPVHYMDDLKKFEPEIKMKKVDMEHAFVLKSSDKVADIVSDFIKTKTNTQ